MSINDLLTQLQSAGLRVERRDHGMVLVGPRERATPALLSAAREYKAELAAALEWDDDHAESAIHDALMRIETAFPQGAPLGVTWTDRRLADAWANVNRSAQLHDRAAFDARLAELEQHVVSTYTTRTAETTA